MPTEYIRRLWLMKNLSASQVKITPEKNQIRKLVDFGQRKDKELTETLALVPVIAGLAQELAGLGDSILKPKKCVKGKSVKRVSLTAKCPKGFKVKR